MSTDEESVEEVDLGEIERRAQAHAALFLREEFEDRQQRCILGGALGLTITGVVVFVLTPLFALSGAALAIGVFVPLAAVALLWWRRFRCPRCEKIPVVWATLVQHRALSLPGCPHCGLSFEVPAP